jgi:hypothetical protein
MPPSGDCGYAGPDQPKSAKAQSSGYGQRAEEGDERPQEKKGWVKRLKEWVDGAGLFSAGGR